MWRWGMNLFNLPDALIAWRNSDNQNPLHRASRWQWQQTGLGRLRRVARRTDIRIEVDVIGVQTEMWTCLRQLYGDGDSVVIRADVLVQMKTRRLPNLDGQQREQPEQQSPGSGRCCRDWKGSSQRHP